VLADEIDILVDLKAYTLDHRLAVSAMRPAPLIVNWLGYPGTLGHARLADYILGDPIVTPLAHAADYTESLALMPHCYQPNDRLRPVGDGMTRAEAGLPEGVFVYCTFNQTYKITPKLFNIWCDILRAVEHSVLWLMRPEQLGAVDNLRREFAARGLDASRLIFGPHLSVRDHMRRLQCADLALDTFPYTSHTTGSDALWAGVPLVTCMGGTFPSRVAASLLTSAGMPELIAKDWREYAELGIRLGTDAEYHRSLRARLVAARKDAPLFDTAGFTKDLEAIYARMWHDFLRGERCHIVLDPA
jgi:predicted O-linked N-acetylglucosamine transferase (SPINDLY family)